MKTSPRYKAKAAKTANEENVAQSLANYLRGQVKAEDLEEFVTDSFGDYVNKPVEFMRDILGFTPWSKQEEICLSVLNNRNTVVESSHSVGKTKISAGIAVWYLATRKGVVISSAPTISQVNSLLWRQMRDMKNNAKKKIPGRIFETARWEFDDKSTYGVGLSPKKGTMADVVAFQGHHHENLMVILDEAGGLTQPLFDAATALATGADNKILAIGNPIGKEGSFYNVTKSAGWHYIHISCFEHPNVVERKDIIPGAVSYGWVDGRVKDWCRPSSGEGKNDFQWEGQWFTPSPVFIARVMGHPADEQENQLISYSWVDTAQAKWNDTENNGTYQGKAIIGLDPARFGDDDTVMVFRIGDHVKWIKRRHGNDVVENASWLISAIKEYNVDEAYVDSIGVGGGVYDIVRNQGYNVHAVNIQHRAMQPTKFSCVHDEAWWNVREVLRLGLLTLPQDDRMVTDLVSMEILSYDAQGRPVFEKKEDMKKRIGRSPDSGDALSLSYAKYMLDSSGFTENYAEPLKSESRWGASGATSRWSVSTTSRKSDSRWRIR